MKTLKLFLGGVSLLALMFLSACDNEEPYQIESARTDEYYAARASISCNDPKFTAEDIGGKIYFDVEGGEVVVNVSCEIDWTVDNHEPDLFSVVTDQEAGTVTITAEQNVVEDLNIGVITVLTSASQLEFATITVIQAAYGAPTISVEQTEWHVPAITDLTTEIAVEASEDWKVDSVSVDWVSAEKFGDTCYLTAQKNTVAEERSALVSLSCTDGISVVTAYITVTQDAYGTPTIKVESEEWNAPAVGELSTTIAVECSDDWNVEVSGEWLSAEKSEEAVVISVVENTRTDERTGKVTISCTDGINTSYAYIDVTQDGAAYITVSAESLSLSGKDDSAAVTVESNFEWTVSYDTSNGWYTVSLDDDSLIITSIADNNTDDDLKGIITLTAGDGAENVAETQITVVEGNYNALILVYTTTAAATEVTLPLSGTVNCTVDWGDGSSESVTSVEPTHTYESAGEYIVIISGTVTALSCKNFASNTKVPALTAVNQWGKTGLTDMTYAFYYCKNLTSIPEDTLGSFADVTSFYGTFYYCSGLTTIPDGLFTYATKATSYGYTFYYCTGLKSIPSGLFDNSPDVTTFEYLFSNCTSLTLIPYFLFDKATGVTSFAHVFASCSALTSIPDGIFANCPDVTDMSYVFYGCSGLTSLPSGVFDNATKATDFKYALYGMTKLTSIPSGLFDKCTAAESFSNTFKNCSKVTKLDEDLFAYCTKATDFSSTFYSMTGLTAIPEKLFANNTDVTTFADVFRGCTAITAVPENLFANHSKVTTFAEAFYGCSNLKTVGAGVFTGCTAVTSFKSVFYQCKALTSLPEGLFAGCSSADTFETAFQQCSALTALPEKMFADCSAATTFTKTFYSCTAIASVEENMFAGCKSVTGFNNTFYQCTALASIPEGLFADCSAVTDFTSVFSFCSTLVTMPAGLFANCPEVTTMYGIFNCCYGLTTIPENLFVNNKKVTSFSYAFQNCSLLESESAYDVIEIDGENVHVHIYERYATDGAYNSYYPDIEKAITSSKCYTGCKSLTDYDDIPSGWK